MDCNAEFKTYQNCTGMELFGLIYDETRQQSPATGFVLTIRVAGERH